MLYLGAKDKTAEEIEEVFGLQAMNLTKQQIGLQFKRLYNELMKSNSSDNELISANRLVSQTRNPILSQYSNQLRDYFNSSLQTVDFLFNSERSVQEINDWVSMTTGGKVDTLLDQTLSPLSVLVLLNAIYFKGQWRQQFLKWATKEEDFYSLNKVIKVSLMKISNSFNYTTVKELNDSQLIELPYSASTGISMYVLLPNDRAIRSIKDKLTLDLFDESVDNMTVSTVRIVLPKFSISSKYTLKSTLQGMGIRQSFTYKSDLSGIDGTNYLHISDVYHKSIIEVDETGSSVTAGIGLTVSSRGLFGRYRNVPTFRADHPFIFIIKHKSTGMILFMGIVNKP